MDLCYMHFRVHTRNEPIDIIESFVFSNRLTSASLRWGVGILQEGQQTHGEGRGPCREARGTRREGWGTCRKGWV